MNCTGSGLTCGTHWFLAAFVSTIQNPKVIIISAIESLVLRLKRINNLTNVIQHEGEIRNIIDKGKSFKQGGY